MSTLPTKDMRYSGLTDALQIVIWETRDNGNVLSAESGAMLRTIAMLIANAYRGEEYTQAFAALAMRVQAPNAIAGTIAIDVLEGRI